MYHREPQRRIHSDSGGMAFFLLFLVMTLSSAGAHAQEAATKSPVLINATGVSGPDADVIAHLERTEDADLLLGIAKGEINTDALQQLSSPNLVDSEFLGGTTAIVVGATFKLDVFGMSLIVTTTRAEEAANDVWTYWGDVSGSRSGTAFFTVGDCQFN